MFLINIITIFPEIFPGPLNISILEKAKKKNIWDLKITNIKDSLVGKKNIDDTPFGGGPGMILKPDVMQNAFDKAIKSFNSSDLDDIEKIMLTPSGEELTQETVNSISKKKGLILVCGRYEGVDERFILFNKLRKVSIGNYVLSGGETPALVISEAVLRLLPGVMGNTESKVTESFNSGLLEYPHYTKPRVWKNLAVPDILLSGNHKKIREWKKNKSIAITKKIKKK